MLSYHKSFLGHIAHVSTMISRRIQIRRIKDKFDDLKTFSPGEFVGYDLLSEAIAPAAHTDLATAFKIRLWKVLQMKFRESKYRDHVAIEMPGQRDWTNNHPDRSLVGSVTVGHNESLSRDNDLSSHGWFSENLHDETHKEVFEDDVDGDFTIEDYEPIQHDTFDDLLYGENLVEEALISLSHPNGEQNKCLGSSTSGVKSPKTCIKPTQDFFREPVGYAADSRSSSVCDEAVDELWDILDQEPHVDGDESLLDDFPSDEGSQSLDLLTDHGFHDEMMMED